MTNISEELIVFNSGQDGKKNEEGVASYRIPALLTTDKGTLIAGIDQRHDHQWDWGNIDLVVRRSEDKGKTWGETIKVISLPVNPDAANKEANAAINIDMNLVQDPTTKRIFSVYGMYPEGKALFGQVESGDEREQYVEIDGKHYLALYKENTEQVYTVREEGIVYNDTGEQTNYRVVMESDEAPYRDLGDLYENGEKIGNVYFNTNQEQPFTISTMTYMWISYSDDDGVTWSTPRDITPQVRLSWMRFYGVGPGVAIALHTGPKKGRLVIPTYSTNHPTILDGSQSSRVIYSDDHGETWHSGEAVNDGRVLEDGEVIHSSTMDNSPAQNTEAVAVQLNSGDIKLFMRNLSGKVQMATSKDGGETWGEKVEQFDDVNDVYVQMSAIQTVQDGEEYVILTNADGPKRFNGYARLAKVGENDELTWIKSKLLQEGKFAYNALQQIGEKEFGVLYEHAKDPHNEYQILFKAFNWDFLTK